MVLLSRKKSPCPDADMRLFECKRKARYEGIWLFSISCDVLLQDHNLIREYLSACKELYEVDTTTLRFP